MEFALSEEQTMLANTLAHWARSAYAFAKRREYASLESVFEPNWAQLAELGALGLNVPAAHGGLGGTPVETFIAMQVFGRVLLVEPFLQTAVVCAGLLSAAGNADQQAELLPEIVSGRRRLALAEIGRAHV